MKNWLRIKFIKNLDFLDNTELDLNSFGGDGGYDKKGIRKLTPKDFIMKIKRWFDEL